MENITYPNPKSLTYSIRFNNYYDIKRLFTDLIVGDTIISLRFKEKHQCKISDDNSLIEQNFLTIVNAIQEASDTDYIDIIIRFGTKTKSLTIYKNRAKIIGCTSNDQVIKVIEDFNSCSPVIKLDISEIQEIFVVYSYKLPVECNLFDLIKCLKNDSRFIIETSESLCLIKYNKVKFRIQNNMVVQTSQTINDGQEAYRNFIENFNLS